MARKTKSIQYVPLEERPEFIAAMAALPAEPVELEVRAERALQVYHDAMLVADVQALDDAHLVFEACVVKLNGGTSFGCAEVQDALAAKFAAPGGHVPKWGQAGEFLLEIDGMRMVVKMCVGSLADHCGAELRAVDFDKPFVSRTGYRHQYMRPAQHVGRTVDQAVRAEVLEGMAREGWAEAIDQEHGKPKDRKTWPWLADALAGVRADGQLAMFGDAPKDPNAKAPLTNADRQRLFRQRQRERREALKADGLRAVELSEVDLARLFIALDTHVSFDQLLDWDLQGYRELAARLFKGEVSAAAMLDQLGKSAGVANYKKRFEVDSKRGWQAYENERENSGRLREKLHAAQLQSGHLQQGTIAAEGGLGYSPASAAILDAELKRLRDAVEELEQGRLQMSAKIYALQKEKALLESERNKAHEAIKTWENRLRAAGQSTDYRPQPGE